MSRKKPVAAPKPRKLKAAAAKPRAKKEFIAAESLLDRVNAVLDLYFHSDSIPSR